MDTTFNNISDYGWENILMNVSDIIQFNMIETESKGLQIGHEWLSPEGCYWLYKLLATGRETILVSDKVLDALRNGTNYPESLK